MKQLQRLWSTSNLGPGALGALPNNTHSREKLLHMRSLRPPTRQPVPVTKQLLKETKNAVKNCVTIAAEQVVEQLEDRFPPTKVQQGLVIIDPGYWLPGNYSQDSFKAASKTVSDLYGVPKRVGDPSRRMVPAVLDAKALVRQTHFVWELATGQQGSISR